VISHLHGDHFGGLPLVLLERALREEPRGPGRPLRIAGPAGTAERVRQSLEVLGWPSAWTSAERSGSVEFAHALLQHRDILRCKRLILTHLGPTVLDHLDQLLADQFEIAEDGLAVEF
jgi:hypothetical protein